MDVPRRFPLGSGVLRKFEQLQLSRKKMSRKTLWPTLLQYRRLSTNFLAISKIFGGLEAPSQKANR